MAEALPWLARWVGFVALAGLIGGFAVTVTLTGHAGDWGDVSVTAALDWAHVVAASAWAGGLCVLAILARRAAPAGLPRCCPW
jgi:putative copper export protein